VLKRFFKWLRDAEDEYPAEVRWLKTNIRKDRLSLPAEGDLLTPEEARQLVRVADHPRDKAFISALYESGGRIGEVATPLIRDVTFEKVGCRVMVNGKTGPRPILLVESAHYLATWLSMHPNRENRDAPLWVNIGNTKRGQPLQYGNVRKLLKTLFQKAGIKKRCNPHLFRHSSATTL
jgi:integrase/recombinase XerD